jgi:acyl-CoA-binding protein
MSSSARSIDPIDEFCLASIFDEASKYLSANRKIKVSQELKLKFYALFKQATDGPCNRPKPSLIDFVERSKWTAWDELGKMSKDEAIARYVKELDQLAPAWREEVEAKALEDGDENDSDEDDTGGSGSGISAGQSKFHYESEGETAEVNSIVYWATQNNIEKLEELLSSSERSINEVNEDGRSALHMAVDRGFTSLVKKILNTKYKANPNLQDNNGATPLHFAVMVEELELVRILLENGADTTIKDISGESPIDIAEGEIKQFLVSSKGSKAV